MNETRKRSIKVIVGIIIFIFVLNKFEGCGKLDEWYRIRAVKGRVHTVLQGIQMKEDGSGTVGDEQMAICRWYADTAIITDGDAFSRAVDEFNAWRKEASFYINEFSIDKVEVEKRETLEQDSEEKDSQPKPWVFFVTGQINGVTYIMRVPEGDTISWIQAPWI